MKPLLKIYFVLVALSLTCQKVIAQEAYAVLSDDGNTVTFYYDNQKASRSGVTEINNKSVHKLGNAYSSATTAVIDASFAYYRPTSTAYWFMECRNLTSISGMENLNTSEVTDMRKMFNYCSNLTSLDVTRFNTGKVTDMNSMFEACFSLACLDVSSFNTENVTDMNNMFCVCGSLTSLDVSNFNTSKVTTMNELFSYCSTLTKLDLSNFNTEKVTDMKTMFEGCYALTSLDISSFNTSNVTRMGDMFRRCYALTSLDLSNFNITNLRSLERMFEDCSALTTIYADEEKWSTANVYEGNDVFNGCINLVGGNGTTYSEEHKDYDYARIDKPGQPGYLTQKGTTPTGSIPIENKSAITPENINHNYTLDGRRIENQPIKKGIYIVNGHKMIIK